ncbi:hypothetical protein [Shewanella dokdonensis]|uniref:Uncharacterized protein n=1 Tax=Shewanella dokdonensis TaxID=712036 RepID=A0ABX8DC51_9GAMM|nr:hypothetical protein [Shewanella dokdonensis]MCL1075492.1 hypothetical protein [Shewanella dokdonensis]QVK22168.1 hypothetical protein KHX94_12065 [Shewanella dokdonensis]
MTESFATTYAKAIDDLAGKIFIPALIASLLVEFGPAYQSWRNAGLVETYLAVAFGGFLLAGVIFFTMTYISIYLFSGDDAAPIIAVFIMPLGFAGLFPEQFVDFQVPFSRVTGVAILAWSFVLLNNKYFSND